MKRYVIKEEYEDALRDIRDILNDMQVHLDEDNHAEPHIRKLNEARDNVEAILSASQSARADGFGGDCE